jgi:hypothetical protein
MTAGAAPAAVRSPARRRFWRSPVRNVDISSLQDAFLVSAVLMILVIRLQLWLTHYPQLGGGKLHIAHLLWGGVFMLIAVGLLLSFLGRSFRIPAAVIGGIGFGFFIDEVGKFVTSDNDYFFKPTAAIIYLVFIGLYLITRAMQRSRGFSQREYLVNAVDALAEAARRDLDEREKRRALELLDKADPADPLVEQVRKLLRETDALPTPEPNLPARIALRARARYEQVIAQPRFALLLGWFFTAWALISIIEVVGLGLALGLKVGGIGDVGVSQDPNDVSVVNLASIASSLIAGGFVVYGVLRLRQGSRLRAYRQFERAVLVQIFIGQFFAFVDSEFSAVFGFIVDILLLITLRYMIRREQHLEGAAPAGLER